MRNYANQLKVLFLIVGALFLSIVPDGRGQSQVVGQTAMAGPITQAGTNCPGIVGPQVNQCTLNTDAFGGTAGTALHSYSANWVNSTLNTSCNDAVISNPNGGIAWGGSSLDCDYNTASAWTNDQFAQATLVTVPSASAYVCVRVSASGGKIQGYCGGADPNGNAGEYFIQLLTTSATTTLNTTVQTPTNGDVMNLQIQGTNLILYVNGISVVTTTDATFATGNPGLFIQHNATSTSILSTWKAGNVQ